MEHNSIFISMANLHGIVESCGSRILFCAVSMFWVLFVHGIADDFNPRDERCRHGFVARNLQGDDMRPNSASMVGHVRHILRGNLIFVAI